MEKLLKVYQENEGRANDKLNLTEAMNFQLHFISSFFVDSGKVIHQKIETGDLSFELIKKPHF